jgi:hypothetical protein
MTERKISMTSKTRSETRGSGNEAFNPSRRTVLSALGGTIALAGCAPKLYAQSNGPKDDAEFFNAYDRTKRFTKGEMDGKPWVAKKFGNFDLDDPSDNNLARRKMTNNLVGERTYIPMIVRLMIGREQEPGGVVLGGAGMFTWQLQEPDPAEFPDLPEGTVLMRSMYTARYLDPETMEPVDELRNPYNGKMMKLEDQLFVENFLTFPKGGSYFVEEPQFANDDPDTVKMYNIKKWGDDLVLFQGGSYSEPGKHQPRFTENMWRCSYKDVMDPARSLIPMSYSFSGVNKAFEKPWMGYTEADEDLLLDLAIGQKVHGVENIPEFHKRVLVEKYPDRL